MEFGRKSTTFFLHIQHFRDKHTEFLHFVKLSLQNITKRSAFGRFS